MTAVGAGPGATRTAAVAIVRSAGLTVEEQAQALGVAHALRRAGLSVADEAAVDRSAIRLVFATLGGLDAALARHDAAPCIVHPMLRQADEVSEWQQRPRGHASWTGSRVLAERLAAAGTPVHWIGQSCELGGVRHIGRRARGLREEDRIFVAFVDERTEAAGAETLQRAWDRRRREPATQHEKATLLIVAAGDGPLRAWQRWADRPDAGAVVVQRPAADPASLAGLLELADCGILFGACTLGGLAPSWTTARLLLRGKPVLALGDAGAAPFVAPPHLAQLDATDVQALAAAMQPVIAGDAALAARCADGARGMLASCSARALAVRAVDSLRTLELWQAIERTGAP